MGLLRRREKIVYWCMPLFLPYFLSSFYHFLSSNPFLFFTFSFLLLSCSGLSPFGLFFSWVLLFGWLSLSKCLPYVPPPPIRSFPLGVFFLSSVFFPPLRSPFFLPWLPSFYSELIQWDFSLLPLGLHQLFLICCGHPFKITHPLIGCPCHCSVHVCCTATHFTTKFPFVCSCCILLPHYLALWHASYGPNHLLPFLGKIPSQQGIFPKEVMAGNQI